MVNTFTDGPLVTDIDAAFFHYYTHSVSYYTHIGYYSYHSIYCTLYIAQSCILYTCHVEWSACDQSHYLQMLYMALYVITSTTHWALANESGWTVLQIELHKPGHARCAVLLFLKHRTFLVNTGHVISGVYNTAEGL